MTLNLGIVGYPIGHSISPVFQQAALDHFSIDAIYQAWEVSPQALPPFIEGLRSPDTLGSNVTVPHKEAVLEWLGRCGPLGHRRWEPSTPSSIGKISSVATIPTATVSSAH